MPSIAVAINGSKDTKEFDMIPDSCPLCHTSVSPKQLGATYVNERLQVIFQCTKRNCEELFIATYKKRTDSSLHVFQKVEPRTPVEEKFSDLIQNASPTFVEIYNQAIAAEAAGLNQINGIGLRKALEFLVKDFAGHQNPNEKEKIQKRSLGACIKTYLTDRNIRECAKRATWLGNDETHYVRKWIDRDITDLKRLINLTVRWIDNVLETEKYVQEMQEQGTPQNEG